jgi:hypothetical protein
VTGVLKNLWSAIILSAVAAWAGTASASKVVIVRPVRPSAQVTETLTFLHGELLSVGLEDTMIEHSAAGSAAGTDPRAWLEQLAADRDAIAVIDVVGDDAVIAVDVWVRKSPGRFEVTRVAVDPDTANSSVRLAIRALEALRASLFEVDFAARYRRDQHATKPRTALPPQGEPAGPTSYRERLGLEVGTAALMRPGGVGPAVMPVVRIDWAARSWLVVQATLAGLGTRAPVTTAVGTAHVAQEYAVLGGCYRFQPDQPWWPWFSMAAGVLRTSVEGHSGLGMKGHTVGQSSFLTDAGLGAAMRVYRSYHLTLSGHVQLAHPYVAIHFGDPVSATTGRPNLLLTLTVGAWL